MQKITMNVEGMMCRMCEKHLAETVKERHAVKKIECSHEAKTCIFTTEEDPTDEELEKTVKYAGYSFLGATRETVKRGLFG